MYSGAGGDERRGVAIRLTTVRYVLVGCFAALAAGFWYLQVAQHGRYRELAENNHLRTLPLRAPRGVLFDRDGRVLVENRYSFNISLVREQTNDLDRSVRLLAAVLGLEERAVRAVVDRHRREPSYRPIVVVQDATLAQVAAVAARRLELPGVVIEEVPARHYPTDELAAHLVGYVGEVTREQLDQEPFRGLKSGTLVGQSGVERAYNALLTGRDGERRVIVNSIGREIETVGETEPVEGRRLQLTIDYDLQRAAERAFRALGYNGAAVVLEPRSGEVLALVSLPAYDPNAFAVGIDRATWNALNTDRFRPLQNRALQGRYSPGSVFKIVMAIAALEEGIITPDFKVTCRGAATFYGRPFLCHKKGGHGVVNLSRALEQSCNVYFYTLGSLLRIDTIHKWATALGLGVRTGIDLPHELEGLVPSSAWKLARTGERWYPGETISVAIGQGPVWVTPLSLAVMIATVANGGTRPTPHVLKAVDQGAGWEPVTPPGPQSVVSMKPETIEAVRRGLWLAVNGAGTAGRARIPGRDVAGKTGTAQVISIQGGRQAARRTDRDLRDHGWFVFFAPAENPEIAGVIFAEHAEHGYLAAPIARHVLETYFAKKEGRPLPEFPVSAPAPRLAAGGGATP